MDARKPTNLTEAAASSASSASVSSSSTASRTPFSSTNPSTLFGVRDIPQDIFNYLAPFIFPETPEGNNTFLNHAFSNEELKIRYKERFNILNTQQVNKLFLHIIHGEQNEAEAMLKCVPGLLLAVGTVKDYSGRQIEGTALQLALGAEDVKYHDYEECMVEMIHKYLKQLPNGEAIIAEQTAKQFPEGWQIKEEQRAMRDSDVLHAVIDTIANSTNPAEWEKAIRTLRNYLEFENKSNIIQTGKHFNHQLLVAALDLYNQNYDSFGGYDSAKNNAVWRKVIGTIERYVPAATAQALCTGVGTIVDEGGKLERTLTLHNYHTNRSISYFPLDADSGSLLGQDFAVYSYYDAVVCPRVAPVPPPVAPSLQNLCQTKTSILQHLCNAQSPSQIAQRPGV